MKYKILPGTGLPKRNAIGTFFTIKQRKVIEIIAALFVLLFVYTALSKLSDLNKFKWSLLGSPVKVYTNIIAWSVPIVELIISILLFIPKSRKLGLYFTFILMSIFTSYIIYMLAFVSNLPCSCGGVIELMSWKQHLFFNSFLILLSILGIMLYKHRPYDVSKQNIHQIIFT
ncbi:MAG: MauE/DoxX family redox-associated membrane protein [Chitinophagaceae bacterium]